MIHIFYENKKQDKIFLYQEPLNFHMLSQNDHKCQHEANSLRKNMRCI